MSEIEITFPDGSRKKSEKGISVVEIASGISDGLKNAAVAGIVDGKIVDLNAKIEKDSEVKILTFKDNEGKEVYWHTTAHIFAQAIKRLFKNTNMAIGPAIENGFYYDFDTENFIEEDLVKIESEMKKIIKEKIPITKEVISKAEAKKLFKGNPYKTEMINDMPKDEIISIYRQGDFTDLCRGPHLPHTGKIKTFKLLKIAGAYWRGDEKNKMLTRVYGISFPDKKELKQYLDMLEEAKKRDHKKIGKELDLFSFHDEAPGFPFWHNKGMVIWNELLDFWKIIQKEDGDDETKTPIILKRKLWEQSGHWFNYKENMYTLKIDDEDYAVKPMNCPGGMLLYKENIHSYRELPLKVGEIGLVHRHELSGTLNGLFRVRAFHQDDAHIFMRPEQIKDQILGVIKLIDKMYSTFGLSYHMELSTRPEKSIGTDEQWKFTTDGLKNALDSTGKKYVINEGDGAFYGPKIDFHIKDALGRTHQCGTIQLDMSLPEKFDLTYIKEDGSKERPIMIHRVIYGSLERFIGILIEHYAGKFPVWLAPVQAKILTVADRFDPYAKKVQAELQKDGIRVEIDSRSETLDKKVRDAQIEKSPYILVVGQKDIDADSVTIRTRNGVVEDPQKIADFRKRILKEIRDKTI